MLRLTGGVPFGRPPVAIECKDVGSVDETRAFIVRLYDMTVLQGHQPHLPFSATNTKDLSWNQSSPWFLRRTSYLLADEPSQLQRDRAANRVRRWSGCDDKLLRS